MWITSSLATAKTPTTVALGNFDGVHLGHQRVVLGAHGGDGTLGWPCAEASHLAGCSAVDGGSLAGETGVAGSTGIVDGNADSEPVNAEPIPTVVTFLPHPQEYFTGRSRQLLTPLQEKARLLSTWGIRQIVLLPFTPELAQLSAPAFVQDILLDRLQASHISVGADFRFGHQRRGTAAMLQHLAMAQGVSVAVVPLRQLRGERISSSRVRHALAKGDCTTAAELLGRPYRLRGRVVKGQQLGRTLGFPTANLQIPTDKLLPRMGVYSAMVTGDCLGPKPLPGVMNIGQRPTVQGQKTTVEVHLLNWLGNAYDTELTVNLCQYVRPEQTFASLEDLKHQIQQDCETAWSQLSLGNCLPLGAS